MKYVDPTQVASIVIRCPNWIGDAVMATVAIEKIRSTFPQAKITAISRKPVAQLFQKSPYIDHFFPFEQTAFFDAEGNRKVVQFLLENKFDLGILLTGSFSSALQFFQGKVRQTVGLSNFLRWPLLSFPIKRSKSIEHDVITYQRLLEPWGVFPEKLPVSLWTSPEEQKSALDMLIQHGHEEKNTLLLVNPGAAYGSAKCWPEEYFKEVLSHLQSMKSVTCVCIGDEKSSALTKNLVAGLPHAIDLSGKTTIRELMAIISIANCLLTNDSGPMHIASAFSIPLIALFGSTNPEKTGPLFHGTVLYKKASCSPCYRRTCNTDFRCMHSITPDEVLTHIKRILS